MLMRVFEKYRLEGVIMPQTNEEWRREYMREHLAELTPQERLKDLSPNELIQALPPEFLEALRKNLDKTASSPEDSTRQG